MGRPPRTAVAALSMVLVATVLVATNVSGQAAASPDLASARAEAARLTAEIQDIEVRAAAAAEDYNAVADDLAGIVSRMLLASKTVDELSNDESARSNEATRRISALYRSGSELSLYATVLDGSSPADVVSRLRTVRSIVDTDQREVGTLRDRVADATVARAELTGLTEQRRRLERKAERARDRVTALLAERQEALATTSETVRTLADEVRTAQRQSEEAAAQTTLAGAGIVGDAPPGNPYAAAAIAAARAQVGDPYVWAATGPDSFDCSGLVMWSYRQAGLSLQRTSRQQWYSGPRVALADLRPGDLLFWARSTSDPGTIHHVAMYVGGGQMIEAPYTGAHVRVVPVRLGRGYIGAARPGVSA